MRSFTENLFAAVRGRLVADPVFEGAFQATFEQAAVGISIMSLDGRFVRVNAKCAEILGYAPEELAGVSVHDLQREAARKENTIFLERLSRGEVPGGQLREKQVRRKDGSLAWVALATSLVYEQGLPSHFVTVVQDISARKQAEDELRRFRVAMDSSADMIFLIDRASMRYIDVNETACRLLGYSREQLLERGPQDILPVSRAALEKAYDDLIDQRCEAGGMNSYYICRDGSHIPFESTRHILSSGDKWLIAAISRDIRERLASQRAIAESERRFRQTFELAGSGIAHVSLSGHFLRANQRLCEILGYGDNELTGRSVKDISHAEDRDLTDVQRARLRSGELQHVAFEKRYIRKDGGIVWANLTVALARDANGVPDYEISILEDITQRREAQSSLRRFRAALDAAADMLFVVDPASSRMLDFNDAVCRTLGYTREELIGQPSTLVRVDTLAGLFDGYARLTTASGHSETSRVRYRHKDGTVFPVESRRRLVDTPEGRLVVVNSRDLRERDAAENALRESEERFRQLTKLSSDWYWEQDAEFRFVRFEGRESAGYDPAGSVLGKCPWELPGIERTSVDWEGHRARLERHEPFRDFEYCYRDRHGNRFYVSSSGEPVYNAQGAFVGYRGTARDITAARRDEEALRRFRAAMDMSTDAIFLTDRVTMRFIDVNKAACRALGYSRPELLASGPAAVFGASEDEIKRAFDEVIASGPVGVRSERSYKFADGTQRWAELHRRALRTEESWMVVTVARDITDRKTAEERRARHLRRQEKVARFGRTALEKRSTQDVTDDALQTLLEALGADVVAYLEPDPHGGGVMPRTVLGLAEACPSAVVPFPPEHRLTEVFANAERIIVQGTELPFAWAATLASVAIIAVRQEDKVRGALLVGHQAADAFGVEGLNFIDAVASILSTALQRIGSEERLSFMAQFDGLTGLPNRGLLADRFSQAVAQAKRQNRGVALLFVDLDGFKMVNDSLGHAAGDEVLRVTAQRLRECVRQGDTVARISGDEFAVVLADLANADDAALVAQKLIARLGESFVVSGNETFVTASIGIAAYPGDGSAAEEVLAAADAAMYRAKQSGKNTYEFFTAKLNERMRARAQMSAELRRALERSEFRLFYQPKIALRDRTVCGAEVLLRWQHSTRGLVSPAEFIPILEETGLILPVGEWVFRQACADLKRAVADGLAPVPLAVNLSARQFKDAELDQRLRRIIREAGIDATLIEVEITESQLLNDPEKATAILRSLRAAGIGVAIDDFGTGYSSLAYLTRLPLTALKVDRSFVARVLEDEAASTIVRSIIDMAHTLGFKVIAEGVEQEGQAAFLRGLRCDEAQGFLFAKPMPCDEFVALLAARSAKPRMPKDRAIARAKRRATRSP